MDEALTKGIITPTEYRIMVRKKGLSLPVGNEIEWQSYRRATLENIVLFNDGVTSGRIRYSDRDLHQVHLDVLDAFMARPEFYLASDIVIKAFVDHRQTHLDGLGRLPNEMEYPEDAATLQAEQLKGAGQQMQQ